MYNIYILFIAIMIISFVTGTILFFIEHKFQIKQKIMPKKDKTILVDEELL